MQIHLGYPAFKLKAGTNEVFYLENGSSFIMRCMVGNVTYHCHLDTRPLTFLTDFTLATPVIQFGGP